MKELNQLGSKLSEIIRQNNDVIGRKMSSPHIPKGSGNTLPPAMHDKIPAQKPAFYYSDPENLHEFQVDASLECERGCERLSTESHSLTGPTASNSPLLGGSEEDGLNTRVVSGKNCVIVTPALRAFGGDFKPILAKCNLATSEEDYDSEIDESSGPEEKNSPPLTSSSSPFIPSENIPLITSPPLEASPPAQRSPASTPSSPPPENAPLTALAQAIRPGPPIIKIEGAENHHLMVPNLSRDTRAKKVSSVEPFYNPDHVLDPLSKVPRPVILDVGGHRHKVLDSNFSLFPNTRLGKLVRARTERDILNLCDGYKSGPIPEFFFDRNWHSFNSILDIYRNGVLHLNTDMCALVLQKDLDYWQIDELILEPCCALKFYPEIEICVKEQKGEHEAKRKEAQRLEDENFGSHLLGRLRTFLWNLMEYPETSKFAQAMAFTSLGVVLISTMTFVLGTFPEFQPESESGVPEEYPEAVMVMAVVDNIAVGFFLMEYVVRFSCAPRKFHFFVAPMNLVDLFAIIPFFLDLIIGGLQIAQETQIFGEDFEIMGKAGKIVRLVRVMRIMRIFKLVRHFAGLQSLIYTLNQAYKELGLLMLLVGVAVLTFSSLVYFAEKDNPLGPWSFLDSFWWGLMTLTTVGYGDLSPSTFPGKLIGGLCALGGIFILTLPIPIVVNSFASYYKNRLWRNEVSHKKRERAKKRKEMELLMRDNLLNILTVPGTPIDCKGHFGENGNHHQKIHW